MIRQKRWIYAVAGILVLLFAGLVYAWSVLAAPIAAYFTKWTSGQLSLTFTICMMFFCLGGFFSGILLGKVSPKVNMLISAVLFLVGFFIAAGADTYLMLYLGYGIMAGLGAGFAYNTVMGTISKYFPDQPGLISGILLMGFGMGSFLIGKIYQAYTGPGEGFRNSFRVLGIALFVVIIFSSLLVRKPTDEEIAELAKGSSVKEIAADTVKNTRDFTTLEMIKSVSFWLYFVWAILLSAAGLALISQASGVVRLVDDTIAAGTVSTVVGLISIFNGCGRVIFGGLFDKIGHKKTMLLDEILFLGAIIVLILALQLSSFALLVIGFVLMGLAYGGVTPTNSAFISAFFGKKYYAVNFSIVNMNLLIASFGSTIAGVLFDRSGSYLSTFIFMIILVAAGSVCATLIKNNQS